MTPAIEQKWILKAEAAQILGVSIRQVERYCEKGLLRMKLAQLPGDRTPRNIYAAEDISRLKHDRETAVTEIQARGHAPMALLSSEGPLAKILEAQVEAIKAQTAVIEKTAARLDKGFLTLDESAAYSGLTVPEISRIVRAKELRHLGRGPTTWRISRESLDEWIRKFSQN